MTRRAAAAAAFALAACGRSGLYDADPAPAGCGARANPGALEVLYSDRPRSLDDAAPVALVLDDTRVWWTDKTGDVYRRAKAGGEPSRAATGQDHPSVMAAAGGRVFWANVGTYGSDFAGKEASIVSSSGELAAGGAELKGVQRLAAWEDAVVVASSTALTSVSVATGRRTLLGPAVTMPTGLAVDAQSIYWMDRRNEDVRSVDRAVGTERVVAVPEGVACCALAIEGADVFFTSIDYATPVRARLASAPKGGGPASLLAEQAGFPTGLAVADGCVYWAVNPTPAASGRIYTCPVAGCTGAPVLVAEGPTIGASLAVDGEHVYFTGVHDGAGAVMRVPR